MSIKTSWGKAIFAGALIGAFALGYAPTSDSAEASGKATCGGVEYDKKLRAGVQNCEITGGSVEIMYTFKCSSIPPKSARTAVTWKSSQSRVISNPCDSTPQSISYKIVK